MEMNKMEFKSINFHLFEEAVGTDKMRNLDYLMIQTSQPNFTSPLPTMNNKFGAFSLPHTDLPWLLCFSFILKTVKPSPTNRIVFILLFVCLL